MHARVARIPSVAITVDEALEHEFDALVQECTPLVFRVAFSVLRHREEAEDVSQDAFVRAYRARRQLRDRARFRGWIVRITFRLALDRQRARRRREAHEYAGEGEVERPSSQGVVSPDHLALWRAIDALPGRLRLPIVLAAIEGYDMHAVAELLNVPEGTVKSRLFAARRRLRELLG
ncbi:MAG: sigma-70 family RNA polymerase sigma factor [Vicinamibacterales bacterium]